jgi:hypothetical protein
MSVSAAIADISREARLETEGITSLGKGPHIGQHLSALFFQRADVPRLHVRFAPMDSLEQIGIGFLFGRR